jgi:pimeloyl-ACP methyl ester carboxylesterase
MKSLTLVISLLSLMTGTYCQSIIAFKSSVKTDPRLIVKSGYLVVPENRHTKSIRTIKIPFVFVRRPDQDAVKNISLYTTGGPGYSTTAGVDSIRYESGFLKFGGFILFDQRGTKKTQPCLDCPEVDSAIWRSYKQHLNKDSLVLLAVKKCRNKFTAQGIDLSAYNTLESAEDINDLRLALHLDSLNLVGISYSGGLMLTVARNHPEAVRTLILNSPLPGYVNYEEHALLNFNEALDKVLDSTLKSRFRQYFTAISGKQFNILYDSSNITYTKNELLEVIINRLNTNQLKTVSYVISQIIDGKHDQYIRPLLDEYAAGSPTRSLGMRYSVYCTEQIAYSDSAIQKQQDALLPWLSGYSINNVDHAICSCWKVSPEPSIVKTPVYSNVPAIISAGDIDPWCRPFYNSLIKRTMPNAQLLILHNRGHGAGYTIDGVDYLSLFMTQPFKPLVSQSKDLIIE